MAKLVGYSGTPLDKKLGIKEGMIFSVKHAPEYYFKLFDNLRARINVTSDVSIKKDMIHYFTTDAKKYHNDIASLKGQIANNGCIWISWPKKTSKIATDVTEDLIRTIAIQNGLVDIKVCAVDETWSGLKLVIPVKNRK